MVEVIVIVESGADARTATKLAERSYSAIPSVRFANALSQILNDKIKKTKDNLPMTATLVKPTLLFSLKKSNFKNYPLLPNHQTTKLSNSLKH